MMKDIRENIVKFSNGVKVINTTPHPCRFQDGDEVIEVPASGFLLNASPVEEVVSQQGGATFVTTKFVGNDEGRKIVEEIRKVDPNVIIIGSIIAAQAYPGVAAMVPAEGFERVPSAEKRMRTDKFTVYLS